MSAGFANSFSALANARTVLKEHGRGSGSAAKRDKKGGQKDKTSAPREPKTTKSRVKDEVAEAPKETKPKEETPKKESKTISLTAEMTKAPEKTEKDLKKEEHLEAKVQKIQNDRTDRQDRSGKGQRVRKEGKGVGGWEESTPLPEDTAPVPEQPADEGPAWGASSTAAAEPTAAAWGAASAPAEVTPTTEAAAARTDKPELSEEEKKRREEEAKARELEEKQMTLDEYMAKLKKDKAEEKAAFNVRKVNKAPLAKMIKATHKEEDMLRVTVKKPAAPPAAPKTEKPKTAEKKAEKKLALGDTGFRMENPAAREGGRGRGRGGRGEGGRGGESRGFGGRGFGRGRGRDGGGGGGAPAEDHSAPQMDSEALFPALRPTPAGGSPTGAAATTATEKAAEPAA